MKSIKFRRSHNKRSKNNGIPKISSKKLIFARTQRARGGGYVEWIILRVLKIGF